MNAHPTESQIAAVLLALWQGGVATVSELGGAAALSVSQTAAAVEILRQRRCLIEISGDQVELIRTDISCWQDLLQARQAQKKAALGGQVQIFRSTDSTNDVCWAAAQKDQGHGLVVLADEQRAGRGRRGRPWIAQRGQSILMSLLLRSCPATTESLTLLLGLACAEALEGAIGRDLEIKWPNDVLLEGKKLAGVIVERREASASHLPAIVLGIGVNVAQSAADFPPLWRASATSVYLALGRQMDRLELVERLLDRIEARCLDAADDAASPQWLDAWKSHCHMLGQAVEIQESGPPPRRIWGSIADIHPLEGLVLRDELGLTHFFSAQRASLVPRPALPAIRACNK